MPARFVRHRLAFAAAALLVVAVACGRKDTAIKAPDTNEAGDSLSPAAKAQIEKQPADSDFLRMMIDHHQGMIEMAMPAMTKASRPETKNDAHRLHTAQQAELDSMRTILKDEFNIAHAPAATQQSKAANDSLQALTGPAYDSAFYHDVITHHEEGIAMIDQYLERLREEKVKAMAERMKAAQQKEIAEFAAKMNRKS